MLICDCFDFYIFVLEGFWCHKLIETYFTRYCETVINNCIVNNLLNNSFKTR